MENKKNKPKHKECHETLEDLTRSIEGGGSCVTFSEELESGDIRVGYNCTNGGFRERGTNTAYYCDNCSGYYLGQAPVNEKGRYCEVCKVQF